MENKEIIETLTDLKKRTEFCLEKGYDMMSAGVMNSNVKEIEALNHAISLLEAEGEGRLIKLPCKQGDTVFLKIGYFNPVIREAVVKSVEIMRHLIVIAVTSGANGTWYIWGISAFKTREAAEGKLKEAQP